GLFESDLLAHGVKQTQNGGLIDCSGNQFWVFDVDGTHQAARQRALAESQPILQGALRQSNSRRMGKPCAFINVSEIA
ncbi:MAG: hypothetical protein MJA27_17895, partial [Pseudanabaenales cyanobacterium]|nr:hypothetical protein [Pseudanabaenales cyanobacterium]